MSKNVVWTAAAFLVAFAAVPLAQSGLFSHIPGDLADARLNNYLLENVYQFLMGRSASLWHPGFFSPFPYVIGFSENLFGSAPVYLVARLLTGEPDTAFQIWFLAGYCVNFASAYYVLRRFGISEVAATVGALVFAFALPVSAHSPQAQLHYRFGVPLAVGMFVLFLETKDARQLLASLAWLVWQFACGIYIGFFTMLFIAVVACVYFVRALALGTAGLQRDVGALREQWRALAPESRRTVILGAIACSLLMVLLFYPYLRAMQLHGIARPVQEIATMLPRPQSYLLADGSWLWAPLARMFEGIPVRHEHQMFMGALPLLLALAGYWFGRRVQPRGFGLIPATLVVLVVLTLSVGGSSLWLLFTGLPLASGIRAVTRIDLVLLFPVAYLAAASIEALRQKRRWIPPVLAVLMIGEAAAVSPNWTLKQEWRDRLWAAEAALPGQLPPGAILFFAQKRELQFVATDLDAMWVAIRRGVPTLNGYSGRWPYGSRIWFGDDCTELPRRIRGYLAFIGRPDDAEARRKLIDRVVPVGFSGCEALWAEAGRTMPTLR